MACIFMPLNSLFLVSVSMRCVAAMTLPSISLMRAARSPVYHIISCDTGLYLEQNDISFITVAICGGYISKNPRLYLRGICM